MFTFRARRQLAAFLALVVTLIHSQAIAAPAIPPPAKETIITLTLRPAKPPAPALKYQFLPELREQTQGNAVIHYHRAGLLAIEARGNDTAKLKGILEKRENWSNLAIKELPREEIRQYLAGYKSVLQELELAGRCERCDWEITDRIRSEGAGVLLPEVQRMREFAHYLSLRARLEMADGKPLEALKTLQTGFVLARHAAELPTLVSALVGVAIGSIMAARVDELIQLPGTPDLYWSLTDLPRPFISLRHAFQGERLMVEGFMPGFRAVVADAKAGPLSAGQLQGFVEKLNDVMSGGNSNWAAKAMFAGMAASVYPEAKQYLLDQGQSKARIEAMPVLQVAFLYMLEKYDQYFDEMVKWTNYPYWQARDGLIKVEMGLQAASKEGLSTPLALARLLVPAIHKIQLATARLDRKIAALRCVEALRLYAANHDGKLPATLKDIKEVPIPIDPITGKDFEYKAEGNKATINCPPPQGEPAGPQNALRYEITLVK